MIKLNVRNKKTGNHFNYLFNCQYIFSLLQEHLDKKVIKVAWKSPLIADTQNYKQMYTVLQVRALVKIIMLWPIPVLCQNNLLVVNWIWQLLQLSKISFLRKWCTQYCSQISWWCQVKTQPSIHKTIKDQELRVEAGEHYGAPDF